MIIIFIRSDKIVCLSRHRSKMDRNEERRWLVNDFIIQNVSMVLTLCIIFEIVSICLKAYICKFSLLFNRTIGGDAECDWDEMKKYFNKAMTSPSPVHISCRQCYEKGPESPHWVRNPDFLGKIVRIWSGLKQKSRHFRISLTFSTQIYDISLLPCIMLFCLFII